MNPKQMIADHRKKYPECPGTRAGCTHWGNFKYMATVDGLPPLLGNLEAFDEETARKLANYMLARDTGRELLTLEIKKA